MGTMDAVEDIKQRLALEDVAGRYVQLKRAGRNWKGLSPFTSERTPSFMVSPDKQIWHDFSSGKGGDMFSFVMEMEGADFRGALEILARQAGVDLDQYKTRGSGRGKEKERLYELLEMATKFYQVHLGKSQTALDYVLKKRQLTRGTALEWRLGYSPESGAALVSFAKQKGFTEQELKAAGLSARRSGGTGDMFRGRVMIPLADPQGRVVGFTARLLRDDPDAPKYINTPSTILYDKSRHIFGLHLAKEAVRKNKFAVLAEGQVDVIASHQTGARQVVAIAGTALTELQLKSLGRLTPDVRLCFDADRAGVSATERAIPMASKAGVSLGVITIAGGKDPDELIRQDPATWTALIEKPKYALDWLIERYQAELDLNTAQGKRQFSDIILAVVKGLADPVEQEHYLGKISGIIDTPREALAAKMRASKQDAPRLKPRRQPTQPSDAQRGEGIKIQNRLLALALSAPAVRQTALGIKPQMLFEDQARQLLEFLQKHPGQTSPEVYPTSPEYVKMLLLISEELYGGIEESEFKHEAVRLRHQLTVRYVKAQKQRIARELGSADDKRAAELLEAAKRLDNLLRNQEVV